MIDILKTHIKPSAPKEEKLNLTREFLQLLILKVISDNGYFEYIAFVGGTALRILHKTNRFSEDLDFSLIKNKPHITDKIMRTIDTNLAQYNISAEIKEKTVKTVKAAEVRFPDLLYQLGLSPLKDQKLMIKVEIDTRPPKGHTLQLSVINEMSLFFTLAHFDLASMFATKLHACFYRTYIKGRDFYDLVWYLGKKIKPNFTLLNNAIAQTEGKNPHIDKGNFQDFLLEKLEKIDLKEARHDVERFLVDKNELKLIDHSFIKKILK